MDSEDIEHCMMYFNPELINNFNGTDEEKNALYCIFYEWNSSVRVSDLCEQWVKDLFHSCSQRTVRLF
jgi:hypothetical protein